MEHHASYNISRQRSMPDGLPAEFDEDAAHPIRDFFHLPDSSLFDSPFTYCDADVDDISGQLGIPWEPSKTIPFSYVVPYLGFEWNLSDRTVAIPERKKTKYKTAIKDWLPCPTHSLDEAQKFYGLMASFSSNPFIPHHASRHPLIFLGGSMNSAPQRSYVPSQAQPSSQTGAPS